MNINQFERLETDVPLEHLRNYEKFRLAQSALDRIRNEHRPSTKKGMMLACASEPNGRMTLNDELGWAWKEAVAANVTVIFQRLCGVTSTGYLPLLQ
jgi:hypothetical protein